VRRRLRRQDHAPACEGYTAADLDRWAGEIAERASQWDDVFVYFKHEEEGKGPEFAQSFVERARARGLNVA
jgi:uncharacterized protein YecE (DUF72 family)